MSTVVTEQVVAGTLAVTAEDGQPLVFPLPEDFVWLKHFSARHLAEFFAELLPPFSKLSRRMTGRRWPTSSKVGRPRLTSKPILA